MNWWKCRTSCLRSSSRTLTFQFVVVEGVPKFLVEVFLIYAQDKVYRRIRQRQWWSILPPAPAVISPPEVVIEYFSPAPAVFQAPAPLVEFFAPAPAVSEAPAPVTEYFLPGPAVFLAPAPVEEYSSPMPCLIRQCPSHPRRRCLMPQRQWWSLVFLRGAVVFRAVSHLVAELFALGELPRRTPREVARMREILALLNGPREGGLGP